MHVSGPRERLCLQSPFQRLPWLGQDPSQPWTAENLVLGPGLLPTLGLQVFLQSFPSSSKSGVCLWDRTLGLRALLLWLPSHLSPRLVTFKCTGSSALGSCASRFLPPCTPLPHLTWAVPFLCEYICDACSTSLSCPHFKSLVSLMTRTSLWV